ncbi:ParB/RepB/Spo0J family partition protein [Phaeovulum sp.]|uniref:ParB/RepB/Spo0J family partition protein n=1 Tax=Phaeovulum sp. TaxID=2934796 RepID=UPI0035628601
MQTPILDLPLDAIDATALPRDRLALDDAALEELKTSISLHGLRQPIEVFELAEPEGPLLYGLISGLRRLTAMRALEDMMPGRFPTIPAFLRQPQNRAEAVAAMVAENDQRADISPWERGLILVRSRNSGLFDTLDAAVAALHPFAPAMKRSRLRALAHAVEELDGLLEGPFALSQRQVLRLAAALRGGWADLIRVALEESQARTLEAQWELLQPVLAEAESTLQDPAPITSPGRPRRLLRPRVGLTIRRERTNEGYVLRFTGPEARGMMIDQVLDDIERMYAPV